MANANAEGSPQQTPLFGKLAEFRDALLSEIEASDRLSSDNAVPLVNGRMISRMGPFVQYTFDIENVLTVPADTPGDLQVPGQGDFDVSIVSIDGLSITIAVQAELGSFVPNATLRSNLTYLMRKLIQRIEAWGSTPNPVGDRILGEAPYQGEPLPANSTGLNSEQSLALSSSLGRNATYIWGPPGTGKTRTIGAIGGELLRLARSVLLVSHTNTAVDQALIHLAKQAHPSQLSEGFVLRVGEPRDQRVRECPDLLLETHRARQCKALEAQRSELEDEKARLLRSLQQITSDIELVEWVSQAGPDIAALQQELASLNLLDAELKRLSDSQKALTHKEAYWAEAKARAQKASEWIATLDKARKIVSQQREQLEITIGHASAAQKASEEAQEFLSQINVVGWLTRKWRGWPAPEQQQETVAAAQSQLDRLEAHRSKLLQFVDHNGKIISSIEHNLRLFKDKYHAMPDCVVQQAAAYDQEVKQIQSDINLKGRQLLQRQSTLRREFSGRLLALREAGLVEDSRGEALVVMLTMIWAAYDRAVHSVAKLDLKELRLRQHKAEFRISEIQTAVAKIEEELREVEDRLIAKALVVATTLTRSYLRDSIQKRRFDTVILDEASMAPIPALWVAASLADANAVVVGDFKQLPPIVISDSDVAKKWLGRDIFEVADAKDQARKSNLVQLQEQFRMHPIVSQTINTLFYDGTLRDGNHDLGLEPWYRTDWTYDCPLLLVDTGPVHAWVTSVPRGGRSSRLNFLSAAICVNIAENVLLPDRARYVPTDLPRILIICPYRPHARLLELMLREQGLNGEVLAGTVYSFQGTEADVVILDLVNDEPHWRIGMFTPAYDEGTRRLLNVAVSRARKRLIVVGDFDYINHQGGKSFVGHQFVPLLIQSGKRVSAAEVALTGIHVRAADAAANVFGGATEATHDRVVVTQSDFYTFLNADLAHAQKRVVIFSAFITRSRLEVLGPQLRGAVERGVRVFVVTKTIEERNRQERTEYVRLEETLRKWRVSLVHKRRMHEKLIFIDTDILWSGSLNPLSFSNTQEHMERRNNRQVVQDYAKTIWLEELIDEYETGSPTCPCCGNELVATEGRDVPFYWRCVQDGCYKRSVSDPRVVNGLSPCQRCQSPVEFFMPKTTPYWRCTANTRHRRKLRRSDLLLPAMRRFIPKRILRDLDRRFDTGEDALKHKRRKRADAQRFLPLDE